jgi:hypothetical protein
MKTASSTSFMDQDSVWDKHNYGGVEYDRLADFPPKRLLDVSLVERVIEISRRACDAAPVEPIRVAELFAGRAPVSRLLADCQDLRFRCTAFDKNPAMQGSSAPPWVARYEAEFDVVHDRLPAADAGRYDWVVMENGLYAATLSPPGTPPYTSSEAWLMRVFALQKAQALLKPSGYLLVSDALSLTSNFGLKRIRTFLQSDVDARKALNMDQKTMLGVFWSYLMEHIRSRGDSQAASMIDVLKRNKAIMSKVQLLTFEATCQLFEGMGFRILDSRADDYLGSNGTFLLQKIGRDSSDGDSVPPIVLEHPIHEEVLRGIGAFRQRVYRATCAADCLPLMDDYDQKGQGISVVYPRRVKPGLAAAASLHVRDEVLGLDAENLMKPVSGRPFCDALLSFLVENSEKVRCAVQAGQTIRFSEVRRLAADGLSRHTLASVIRDLCHQFTSYEGHGIAIVLFVSDEKRLRLFNRINADGGAQFRKVAGFVLAPKDVEVETMMIAASDYFFGPLERLLETGLFDEDELERIQQLKSALVVGESWREAAEALDHPARVIRAVEKFLDRAPGKVNLYFTDHAMC